MKEEAENNKALAELRRRLYYRAWRRGTREMDLLLGRFADACLAKMDAPVLALFEQFLNQPDPKIHDWLIGLADSPPGGVSELTAAIKRFHKGGEG